MASSSERSNTTATTFERDVVTHQGAVAILAINERGEIGMIRQYRTPFDRLCWEIPAGTLDVAGEDPLSGGAARARAKSSGAKRRSGRCWDGS